MIDWHSHILPGMDDGSRDVDESLTMLEAMEQQGVDTVIATPHFYANEESVDDFLKRRKESYELLCSHMDGINVHIMCGAEVRYYTGISRMADLKKLAIENTRLLLLEMPMTRWTEFTVKELADLANTRGLKLMMAHIERYIGMQDKKTVSQLCEYGVLMQVNATFFERFGSRQKALKLLDAGYIHCLGSDCHNMTTRPPKISVAYDLIEKKFGDDYIVQMAEYGKHLLGYK